VAGRVNLGQLYVIQGRYPPAQEHYTKALELARESGDTHAEAMVLGNIGQAWVARSRLAEAESWLKQAEDYSRKIGDHDALMNAARGLAELDLARENWQAARERLESTVALALEQSHGDMVCPCRRLLARAWRGLGDLEKSREHALAALETSRSSGHRVEEMGALQELARTKKEAGEDPHDEVEQAAVIAGDLGIPFRGESIEGSGPATPGK
jgi:tetratricopeptide (TPR) repeat protein